MKYYSEKTKKLYDSEEELNKAEVALSEKELETKKLRDERAKRAKEVDDAYNKYVELLKAFVKDYHYYHRSLKDKDVDWVDWFYNNWLPF